MRKKVKYDGVGGLIPNVSGNLYTTRDVSTYYDLKPTEYIQSIKIPSEFQHENDFAPQLNIPNVSSEDLEYIQNINVSSEDLNKVVKYEETPLTAAILRGVDASDIEVLIKSGADVNMIDGNNFTPLTRAIAEGRRDIVQLLIKLGADLNKKDGEYYTPLGQAIYSKKKDIIRLLIESGVDINKPGRFGYTPLVDAIINTPGEDIAELLIILRADINKIGENDRTPLHTAILFKRIDIIDLLIRYGADVNMIDRTNFTPLTWASEMGYIDIVQLLIKRKADINLTDGKGDTPLTVAISSGNYDIAYLLIKSEVRIIEEDLLNSLPNVKAFTILLRNFVCSDEYFLYLSILLLYIILGVTEIIIKEPIKSAEIIIEELIKRKIKIFENSSDIKSCPICMEEYSENPSNECIVLVCGHSVHRNCLLEWINTPGMFSNPLKYRCPNCNSHINREFLREEIFPFMPYLTCKQYKDLIQIRNDLLSRERRIDGRKYKKSRSKRTSRKKRKSKSKSRRKSKRKSKSKSRRC